MAGDPLEIKLPESFFEALSEVKESINDGFDNSQENLRPSFYSKNILDAPGDIQKIAPVFDHKSEEPYKKIGNSLFTGGTKAFFDYWAVIKKQEDYAKRKVQPSKQLAPVVNIDFPKEAIKLPPKMLGIINTLGIVAGAILAFLGIMGGTNVLGQIAESITYLPNLAKNTIFDKKWTTSKFAKINKFAKNISLPFTKLATFLSKFGFVGKAMGKVVDLGGKAAGGLSGLLGKGLVTITQKIGGSVFKKLPLIGLALSFYQAYLRFQKGEWVQGITEIAAGIVGQLGPLGVGLSFGINLIQSLWDSGIGGGAGINLVGKGLTKLSGSFFKNLLAKGAKFLFKGIAVGAKRIPVIGSLISLGFAIKNFIDGEYLKGTLNILSGIAAIFPGLGTAIGIGIDALNYFLTETETGGEVVNYVKNTSFSQMFDDLRKFVTTKYGKYVKHIPIISSFIRFGDGIDLFKKGNYLQGIRQFVYGSLSILPFGTALIAGFDFIERLATGTDSNSDYNFKTKESNNSSWLKDIQNWCVNIFSEISNWVSNLITKGKNWITNFFSFGEKLEELPNDFKLSPELLAKARASKEGKAEVEKQLRKKYNIHISENIDFGGNTPSYTKDDIQYILDNKKETTPGLSNMDIHKMLIAKPIISDKSNPNIQLNDKRSDAVNKNFKADLINTNDNLNDSKKVTLNAFKKQDINIQALSLNQDVQLAKIVNRLEVLTTITKDKPVAFANLNNSYITNNQQQANSSNNRGVDPRLAYA